MREKLGFLLNKLRVRSTRVRREGETRRRGADRWTEDLLLQLEKIEISTPKIPEMVMNRLLDSIESGEISVGDELPSERDLAEGFGVSRGSIRECIAILSFMGIVENRGHRKVVVKEAEDFRKALSFLEFSRRENTFWDLMDFRRCNELEIAKQACQHATQRDLDDLKEAVDTLAKNPEDIDADMNFNMVLAQSSHNAMFMQVVNMLNYMIRDLHMRYFDRPDYYEKMTGAQSKVYEAVRRRDTMRASMAMSHYLDIIEKFYCQETGEKRP